MAATKNATTNISGNSFVGVEYSEERMPGQLWR